MSLSPLETNSFHFADPFYDFVLKVGSFTWMEQFFSQNPQKPRNKHRNARKTNENCSQFSLAAFPSTTTASNGDKLFEG